MSYDWIPVSREMPDTDLMVMVACPDESEPVWIGFHDGEQWVTSDLVPVKVTHWQNFPEGPK